MKPPAIRQNDALHFGTREDTVKNGIEQVITQCPAHSAPSAKAVESIFWPANVSLQCLEVEGLGAEEGGSRTSGDIVAGEVHGVEEGGQAKDDTGCTEPEGEEPLALATSAVALPSRLIGKRGDTHGPPNS